MSCEQCTSFFERSALKLMIMIVAKPHCLVRFAANTALLFWKLAGPAHGRPMVTPMLSNKYSALRAWYLKKMTVVQLAKSFDLCCATALRTLNLWPPAFTAKIASVLRFVKMLWASFTATLTSCRHFLLFPKPLIVMMRAETSSEMRPTAQLARVRRAMYQTMFAMVFTQLKIFKSIIVTNLIFVMNYLFSRQTPTNGFLHNKPVLHNVTPNARIWMIRHLYPHISTSVNIGLSVFEIRPTLHGRHLTMRFHNSAITF